MLWWARIFNVFTSVKLHPVSVLRVLPVLLANTKNKVLLLRTVANVVEVVNMVTQTNKLQNLLLVKIVAKAANLLFAVIA